jgi:DNA-binding MarR family transcriptional regulator
VDAHQRYEHQILDAIDGGQTVSQRSLSGRLGIALGLTNLLMRRLIRKGWVRVRRIPPNRLRYFLTPAGLAEKSRLSGLYLRDAVAFYATARARVRDSLARVGAPSTRIVFYGTGEMAEIAYVCLRETDLTLVAVVPACDEAETRPFFGVPVCSPDDLKDGIVGDQTFDVVVITSFHDRDAARWQLEARGVSPHRMHWL